MAEANRKYVPPVDEPLTPGRAVLVYGPLTVARFAAAVVTGSGIVWGFAIVTAVVEAFLVRAALERDRARRGSRPHA